MDAETGIRPADGAAEAGSNWKHLNYNFNYTLCVSHRGFVVGVEKDGFQSDPAGCWRNSAGSIPPQTSTSYGYMGALPKTLLNF